MEKKFIKNILILMFVLVGAVPISSCSKDDDKNNDYTIVGTWKYSWEDGYILMTLNSNGTAHIFEYEDCEVETDYDTQYTYDSTTKCLTIMSGDYKCKTVLSWSSKNSFWADIADGGETWTRQ